MNDEGFHLTAVDVRRYELGSALRGYDKARVDQLRDQVADELERLTRVNQELEAKAKGFHEQLRAFRERDKALNDALVSAQQLRADTKEQAEREAILTLREAQAEGQRLIDEAKAEVRRLSVEIDALTKLRRTHLAQARALAERHLTDLQSAEAMDTQIAAAEKPRDTWLDAPVDGPAHSPDGSAMDAPVEDE